VDLSSFSYSNYSVALTGTMVAQPTITLTNPTPGAVGRSLGSFGGGLTFGGDFGTDRQTISLVPSFEQSVVCPVPVCLGTGGSPFEVPLNGIFSGEGQAPTTLNLGIRIDIGVDEPGATFSAD